jgi:hypothetical protein
MVSKRIILICGMVVGLFLSFSSLAPLNAADTTGGYFNFHSGNERT